MFHCSEARTLTHTYILGANLMLLRIQTEQLKPYGSGAGAAATMLQRLLLL